MPLLTSIRTVQKNNIPACYYPDTITYYLEIQFIPLNTITETSVHFLPKLFTVYEIITKHIKFFSFEIRLFFSEIFHHKFCRNVKIFLRIFRRIVVVCLVLPHRLPDTNTYIGCIFVQLLIIEEFQVCLLRRLVPILSELTTYFRKQSHLLNIQEPAKRMKNDRHDFQDFTDWNVPNM